MANRVSQQRWIKMWIKMCGSEPAIQESSLREIAENIYIRTRVRESLYHDDIYPADVHRRAGTISRRD